MRSQKPTLLFVTDLYYEARQRVYHTEDLFLTSRLRDDFDLALCHPQDTPPFEETVDAILLRNSGPVFYYQEDYEAFRKRLLDRKAVVYNSLDGKGDMQGKNYLVDLTKLGFPVIPTVDTRDDLHLLPKTATYVTKPRIGADSIGMQFVGADGLGGVQFQDTLVQPKIDFLHEISFYFIDESIQYALYAPNRDKRWQLETYEPSQEDLDFAQNFITWNGMKHGIQRVDACRTRDGKLLLVELEDLNPFLSLLEIEETFRESFVENLKRSLHKALKR